MEQPIFIVTVLTLLSVTALIFLYLITEKKKKSARLEEVNQIKQLLKTEINEFLTIVQNKMQEHSIQTITKFDALANDVRTGQENSNLKINSSFDQLQADNSAIRKDLAETNADVKTSFKEYSEKVKESLNRYSNDNAEFKKDIEKVKVQIQKELQTILKEIKSPLDLD